MAREQVLYQIIKLSSKFICENNLDIPSYDARQAALDGNLVSLGDNIAFQQARFINGDNRNHHEIFKEIEFLRGSMRRAKKEGRAKDAKIFWYAILNKLFVKDFVLVTVNKKSEYRRLAKAGFYLNGVRYVRFSASAGQIRHNTVQFCLERIYEELFTRLMCDLNNRIAETNIAKLSAYFSLSTSSIMWVSKPRVCIIKDFETTLKDQKIDWIINTEDGKKAVEERVQDVTMNSCDGQGLVSPEMAMKWSEEMGLDYVASSYVVRSVFIKGNLVPFDFKAYAAEHNISIIYDRWGIPHKIEDIDCLISESQFKEYKAYSSWEDFDSYATKYNIGWGVSRYNKKYDDEWVLANYQYIQVLNIKEQDVKELIQPTIDWLQKVCSGDDLYAMLYSLGGFNQDTEIEYSDVYTRAQNLAMKAVVKNPEFLKDSYVQRKIYKNIVESINKSKIGKIWVKGNYSFMISDPIAQCQSALGLPPVGVLPGEHFYSNFWKNRANIGDEIVLCRSPLLDKHEINHCKLFDNEETTKWYKWIESGIVYSIYDLSTLRHSDSDFDGDICMSTNNTIFLKGSMKDYTNPITYKKQPAPSHKICHRNFIETDIRGFGTKVGTYSNYSTIIEAMLPMFQRPEQQRQREELLLRIKLLREINGQEIDRIKGVEAKGPPKDEWLKIWDVLEDDTEEEKKKKRYHNSLVISKKPYFFRYLYPELNKAYKKYENKYNETSKCMFGTKLKKLLVKENKTKEENDFVKKYHKFLPLINTNCTMNLLCRDIESIDFDIKYNKNCTSMLPYYDLNSYIIIPDILQKFRDMYRKYCNKKAITLINSIYFDVDDEDFKDIRFGYLDIIKEEIQNDLMALELTTMETLTYIKALSQSYTKFNWDFAWQILGNDILDCIEQKQTYVPIECEDGEEFLGRKYKLMPISRETQSFLINEDGEIVYE